MLETITITMTLPACPQASLTHPTPLEVSYGRVPPTHPGFGTDRYMVTTANGAHLCTSRTPFYSAARALIQQGYDPRTVLFMSREGDPEWSMRAPIGKAAKLTVQENAKVGPRIVPYDGERLTVLKANRTTPNGN